MEDTNQLIFIGSFLMLLSILAGQISTRLGAPLLLTFLGVGIFFGEDGPGGIIFNDKKAAYMVSSIALAIILFDGGLRTHMTSFKNALKPALALSTFGVLITAVITGLFAAWMMNLGTMEGLLVGAIVASTDAAAVFLLLHQKGINLRPHVSDTLEVESGINDPMAVFLTTVGVAFLASNTATDWISMLGLFVRQMGLGAVIGYAGGMGLLYLLRTNRLETGLYPVVVLAGGLLVFGAANMAGASGFLAVYIAGVIFANGSFQKMMLIKHFNDGMAWIAQLVMLLTLGLLVTPSKLVGFIFPALMIALVLILVARPVAVWCCLPGKRFNGREKVFISWVGLRGAIPIYLALIPTLSGIENSGHFFNIAFIIVLASLLVQGWTINPMARWLGITLPQEDTTKPR